MSCPWTIHRGWGEKEPEDDSDIFNCLGCWTDVVIWDGTVLNRIGYGKEILSSV
jgi:hypothetical protein